MKIMPTQIFNSAISIAVFISLYLIAYFFFGTTTGDCLSSARTWVGNFETIIIAICSVLAGNFFQPIRTLIRRK